MSILVAAVISMMHYEGDVPDDGNDYQEVEITVPAGTQEIEVAHTDGSDYTILDWGVWQEDGSFRGWGGGLTADATIGVTDSSRCYLPGPIVPGTWKVVIGKAQLDASGNHYAIDVTYRDSPTLASELRADYVPVTLSTERRWYKGDFHVHSIQSGDASATFEQIISLARSRGLDFVNFSDHNTVSQHALLAAIQPMYADFLFLRGAEITTYGGHGNAVGIHDYVDHRIGLNGRTIANVIDDVRAQGGVFIVNHPVLDLGTVCIGCNWQHVDDTPWDEVTGMEVLTGNFDLGVSLFYNRAVALWDKELDAGHRIAAIGGSDDHTAGMNEGGTGSPIGSPTTLVLADNLSEAAIIDALEHGRTMVDLAGPDAPVLDFKLGDHEIGDEVTGAGHLAFTVHITGGNGTFLHFFHDGVEDGDQITVDSDDFTTTIDRDPTKDPSRYRVQLDDQFGHPIVVTSHIYASGTPDGGGCCSTSRPGATPLLALLVYLKLAESIPWRWRRRRKLVRSNPASRAASDTEPFDRSITRIR